MPDRRQAPRRRGTFDDETDAARAYDRAAVEHFGEFAHLNFPEEWPPNAAPRSRDGRPRTR